METSNQAFTTPNLDLYNFTDPMASDSQYVLTSPRSLEVRFLYLYLLVDVSFLCIVIG